MLFLSTIKKSKDFMHKCSLSRKIMDDDYKGKVLLGYNEVVMLLKLFKEQADDRLSFL
jgi:hypothetical protein